MIIYEELIKDACKGIRNDYLYGNYSMYEEYMVAAKKAYWRACRERYCCHLDDTVRLPGCVESIVHDFIKVYGSEDDDIPAAYCGRGGIIFVPKEVVATQRGTQGSPETLSGDEDATKSLVPWSPVASANYATTPQSDGSKPLPVVTGMKALDFRNLKAVIIQFDEEEKQFDEEYQGALEAYQNASWRSPKKHSEKPSGKPSEASDMPKQKKNRCVVDVEKILLRNQRIFLRMRKRNQRILLLPPTKTLQSANQSSRMLSASIALMRSLP